MRRAKPATIIISIILLALSLAGITVLVYIGGTDSIAVHLFYLPIIYAGVVFGDYGAFLVGMLAALACGPWAPSQITPEGPVRQDLVPILLRVCVFFVIGFAASRTSYELRRRATEAHTLYEVARSVTSTLRLRQVLDLITRHSMTVMNAKASSIRLLNEETGELDLAATAGLDQEYWQKGPVSVPESPVDRQVLSGEAEQVYDVRTDPRFQYPEAARQAGLTSILTVPLQTKDKVLGVVRVYAKTKRRFSPREVELLTAFAHQASVAIENAELYEDIRHNYYETVRALTRAIEAKDSATYSHSERVTHLTDELAREVGMTEEQRELLRFGSILHDVGKIGVEMQPGIHVEADPDQVFYQMHPLIGRTILSAVGFLSPVLPVVVHHHESWDGSGFPQGLTGADIPYEARIVSICDAYDRLVNPRTSGESSLSPKEAAARIVDEASSKFDPTLAAAFRRVMRANHYASDEESEPKEPLPEPVDKDI